MTRRKKQSLYVTILTVKMSGPCPYDMLRYDNCVPASERESSKLARLAIYAATEEERVVSFRRFSVRPTPDQMARDRWASFGCEVLDERPVP